MLARRFGLISLAAALVGCAAVSTATGAAAVDDVNPTAEHVVVIGTSGIQWSDIDPVNTPQLWTFTGGASVANVTTRTVRSYACPSAGWLALNSGARAADLDFAPVLDVNPDDPNVTLLRPDRCRAVESPNVLDPDADPAAVPRWEQFIESAGNYSYDPDLGLLGDVVEGDGLSAAAIGPGAAIALADSSGHVAGEYADLPTASSSITGLTERLSASRLLIVDAGAVRDQTERLTLPQSQVVALDAAAIHEVDRVIGAVLAGLPDDARVLIASLADSGTTPRLQFMAMNGPSPYGLLGSSSTRQDGLVQGTDMLPTVLDLLGVDDGGGDLGGAPIHTVRAPVDVDTRIHDMVGMSNAASTARLVTSSYSAYLVFGGTAVFALVALVWRVRRVDAIVPVSWRRQPARFWGRLTGILGIMFAASPVSGTLANLVPWWFAGTPRTALQWTILGWTALVSAVALLGPWRRSPLGPPTVVAAVTAVTLAADVATGATLQTSAVLGVQPLVAGRFYGFSNNSFPLFAVSMLWVTMMLVQPLLSRGRRGWAVLLVSVIGVATTLLVGWPGVGSDFGGPPALIPAFAVLAVMISGLRISWRKALLIVAGTALAMVAFCVADWLRPPSQRTHLGRVVQTILDGGFWPVLDRKISQNIANLTGTWLFVVVLAGVLFAVFVFARRTRFGAIPLALLKERALAASPAMWATVVMLAIGLLVNDSGILVPALGVAIGVALLIGAGGRLLAADSPA